MKTSKSQYPTITPTSDESKRTVRLKANCEVPCYIAVAVLQNMTKGSAESSNDLQTELKGW